MILTSASSGSAPEPSRVLPKMRISSRIPRYDRSGAIGRVWVIESNTHFPPKNYKGRPTDRILIFEDFAADGHAGKVTTFAEGFRYSMGIGFGKTGDLYLATRWEVYRWHGQPNLEQRRDSIVKLDTKGN